jgi:ParB-like chromosome segregation protein Spo0J
LKIRSIPFKVIDLTDITYCLTLRPADSPAPALCRSVQRVGILHPPLLRERANNSYQVVAGRQRLLLARDALGQASCPCLVLAAASNEGQVLEALLAEALATRTLTVVEQALFLQKATPLLGKEETAQRFLPLLERSPHPLQVDRLLELLRLEEPLLDSLHAGELDETVARAMVALPLADRLLLHDVITALKLGVGKQRKLVTACQDLAARHRCTVSELFDMGEVQHILRHPDANLPQKGSNLMAWLARMLQPRLAENEQAHRRLVESLHLPPAVSLTHAPAFEKESLTLAVTVRSENELQEAWGQLRPLLQTIT